MPLTFSGLVMVEELIDTESNQANSPGFNAIVVAQSSSDASIPFKVSIWVDTDNNMYPPVEFQLFHLDGKLSSGTENMLEIEAMRFFPMVGISTALPAFILGTGLFIGRPKAGLFNLKSMAYANGTATEVGMECFHSAKQYHNVAKTIQKNQEIYFKGFLHDIQDDCSVVLNRCQFSYLGKGQKLLNTTATLLNVARDANVSAKHIMRPRKLITTKETASPLTSPDVPSVKKIKRGVTKKKLEIIADLENKEDVWFDSETLIFYSYRLNIEGLK